MGKNLDLVTATRRNSIAFHGLVANKSNTNVRNLWLVNVKSIVRALPF